MKPKLGRVYKVQNANPKWGANTDYKYIKVRDIWGVEMDLMFTDRELLAAEKRAGKNPEDKVRKISLKEWLKR